VNSVHTPLHIDDFHTTKTDTAKEYLIVTKRNYQLPVCKNNYGRSLDFSCKTRLTDLTEGSLTNLSLKPSSGCTRAKQLFDFSLYRHVVNQLIKKSSFSSATDQSDNAA